MATRGKAKKSSRRGPPAITTLMVWKHLRCPHWVYWDFHGDAKSRAKTGKLSEKIWKQGIADEREAASSYGEIDELPESGDDAALSLRTLELMKAGSRIIYRGRIMDGNWMGTPDLLFRASLPLGRKSAFGDYIYEPYDFKSAHLEKAEDMREEYKITAAFHAVILEKIQGVRPEYGHVIDAERRTADIKINDSLDALHAAIREIEKAVAGEKPAPFLASSCKESPWFEKCKRDAELADDICLIYKVRRPDHAKLYAAGVKTVSELAEADIDDLQDSVEGISRRKLESLKRQAGAISDKKAITIGKNPLPRSEAEYHFDVEGDPLRGLECLLGVLEVKGPKSKGEYRAFAADSPEDEGRMWRDFLDYMKTVPEGAPIYHYGTYERSVVRRLAALYGGDEDTVAKLERQMFNLLTTVCESVALPVYFYSLKDIAKYLGFKWRHSEASGVNTIIWYEEYLRLKDSKKTADRTKAKKYLRDVIEYNEDDVRATLFLKRWLDDLPDPT